MAGALLALSVCSCSSLFGTRIRCFHEEAKADVVVQFTSWEAISITKPDTTEGRFTQFYRRPEAERRLEGFRTGHNLAVVVCAFNYAPERQAEHQREWQSIFSRLGFHRVVFVRPTLNSRLNGAEIVLDTQLDSVVPAGG